MIDDKISSTPPVMVPGHEMNPDGGGRHDQHGRNRQDTAGQPDEVRGHYEELIVLVEQGNFRLLEEKSPFRFVLNREGESIIIDIIRLSPAGEAESILHKNITHEKFREAVSHILRGEGLVIDRLG